MAQDSATASSTTHPALTGRNKAGLVLAALLGLSDLAGPFTFGTPADSTEAGPPLAILIMGAVVGLITLIAVVWTWRTANRVGSRIVAGTRILSVVAALPAFFVPDVPAPVVASVAVLVVVTIATVALVLARPTGVRH